MNRFRCLFAVFVAFLTVGMLYGMTALAAVADPNSDFITQLLTFVQGWGGFPAWAKLSGILMLIVASMKVSWFSVFWQKLGSLQIWFAPFLGLVAGVISLLSSGQPLTLAAVMAYVSAGAGAVFLHEILDWLKLLPGIGAIWVSIINIIESALGGPASRPKPVAQLRK